MILPFLALLGSPAAPLTFVPAEPRTGDAVLIYLELDDPAATTASANLFGFDVALERVSPSHLRGIAAVPMDVAPRSFLVTVTVRGVAVKAWLNVRSRDWAHDELEVSSAFTGRKPRALVARIKREQGAWDALFAPPPTPPELTGKPQRPLGGAVKAPFGTQRIFNGRMDSVHYGLDLAGKMGDPVQAVGAGRVVMSAMRWASGGTIVIDHGGGLFTAYFHLSRREVEPGGAVRAGQRIGRVGKSGRVTGPHLHLAVMVRMADERDGKPHGLYVDPEAFLDLDFAGDPAGLGERPAFR